MHACTVQYILRSRPYRQATIMCESDLPRKVLLLHVNAYRLLNICGFKAQSLTVIFYDVLATGKCVTKGRLAVVNEKGYCHGLL